MGLLGRELLFGTAIFLGAQQAEQRVTEAGEVPDAGRAVVRTVVRAAVSAHAAVEHPRRGGD